MYKLALTLDNGEINIPVLPEKLEIKSPGKNEKAEVLTLGEITLIRKKGLKEIAWSCFFPAQMASYVQSSETVTALPVLTTVANNVVDTPLQKPIEIVRMIQQQRDAQKPIWFTIVGTDLDVNIQMAIQDFGYEERSGELGDIYYHIALREWVDYAPKQISLSTNSDGKTVIKIEEPKRPGLPGVIAGQGQSSNPLGTIVTNGGIVAAGSGGIYTAQQGDTLWTIAKKLYDDPDRYLELYESNKDIIRRAQGDTRAFLYDLVAGQVLKLP